MSYTFRYKGIEVVCDTIEELQTAAHRLGEGDDPVASSPAPQAPPSRPRLSRQRTAKPRGIADATYLKYAWRVVRSLLATNNEVGRLRSTLAKEFDINKSMMEVLLRRLVQEQPIFLLIHQEAGRGISPYVRLTNREAAQNFADAQERLYRAQLEAELKT